MSTATYADTSKKAGLLASQLSIPYEHVLALTRRQPALLTMAPEALKYKIGRLAIGLGISNHQALVMAARRMSVLDAAPATIIERCQLLGELVDVAPEQVRQGPLPPGCCVPHTPRCSSKLESLP